MDPDLGFAARLGIAELDHRHALLVVETRIGNREAENHVWLLRHRCSMAMIVVGG